MIHFYALLMLFWKVRYGEPSLINDYCLFKKDSALGLPARPPLVLVCCKLLLVY